MIIHLVFGKTKHENYGTLCSHHTKCLPEKFPKSEKVLNIPKYFKLHVVNGPVAVYKYIPILLKTGTPQQRIPHFPPRKSADSIHFPPAFVVNPRCVVKQVSYEKRKKLVILSIASTSIMTNKYNQETI